MRQCKLCSQQMINAYKYLLHGSVLDEQALLQTTEKLFAQLWRNAKYLVMYPKNSDTALVMRARKATKRLIARIPGVGNATTDAIQEMSPVTGVESDAGVHRQDQPSRITDIEEDTAESPEDGPVGGPQQMVVFDPSLMREVNSQAPNITGRKRKASDPSSATRVAKHVRSNPSGTMNQDDTRL